MRKYFIFAFILLLVASCSKREINPLTVPPFLNEQIK
ncbi:MAG: lipoprotein [Rickettsiales bacterium]|nr:lipoprotein [Rickettsiales bacterium]